MLIYLARHAWQVGQLSTKGGPITPSSDPITFTLLTGMAGVAGIVLIGVSPLLLLKILAPDSEQSRFAAEHPGLYRKTRPALLWTLIALLAVIGYAFLVKPARAITAGSHSRPPSAAKGGHVVQLAEDCATGLRPSGPGLELRTGTSRIAPPSLPLPWMSP